MKINNLLNAEKNQLQRRSKKSSRIQLENQLEPGDKSIGDKELTTKKITY